MSQVRHKDRNRASGLSSPVTTATHSDLDHITETTCPGSTSFQNTNMFGFGSPTEDSIMPANTREALVNHAKPHLVKLISRDGTQRQENIYPNQTVGIIRVLACLCSMDKTTLKTYLSHPNTTHVRKIDCEGEFCGYWSIQVLLTYISHRQHTAPRGVPNVLEIQDIIEQAWDCGMYARGRMEIGSIRGTMKHIGTLEVLAFLSAIYVPYQVDYFKDSAARLNGAAATAMLNFVERYFTNGAGNSEAIGRSSVTDLAPIFIVRPGHCMVVVGIERKVGGTRDLLVFSSDYGVSHAMLKLIHGGSVQVSLMNLLRVYRRSEVELQQYSDFELIT